MNYNEKILSIVNLAQQKLGTEKVSIILNDCLRIAILRNDFLNQWWIRMEFCTVNDNACKKKYPETIKHKFTPKKYEQLWKDYLMEWINERNTEEFNLGYAKTDSKITALSISEIENSLESAENSLKSLVVPQNMDSDRTYEIETENFRARTILEPTIKSFKNVIERIRTRAANFLNETEYELISGKTYSEIFQRTKEFVDSKLADIAPDVLQKFISIKLDPENTETFAHSLVTCRRVLKSFADSIYPASKNPVLCSDGKERILNDEKYVSRIWQYIFEKLGKTSSAQVMQSQLESLGKRVDHIYNLTNKGIHAEVDEQEANQCVIQTYLIIGDVLRIK